MTRVQDADRARLVSLEALCIVLDLDSTRPCCPRYGCGWPLEVCQAPAWPGISLRCRRQSCVLELWAWADDFTADALRVPIDAARRYLLYAEEGLQRRRVRAS